MPSARLTGGAAMKAKMKRLRERFPDEVGRALRAVTEEKATMVKRRTPVAPGGGDLRSSVHAVGPIREGRKIYTLIVAGGGPSAPYAIAVHEHLSEHSPPSWRTGREIHWNAAGTGPKFIESVVMEGRADVPKLVAEKISLYRAMEG